MIHVLSATAATAPASSAPWVIGPFILLFLAIPVLLFGEQLVKRIGWLAQSNIPAPIIGGLIIAVALLILNEARPGTLAFDDKTNFLPWLWTILPQWGAEEAKKTDVFRPLLLVFFTCIGLNASWAVAKKGSWQLLWYLLIATFFAAFMIITGVLTAKLIGADPLLGIMCSGGSLMGGFGTAAAFAPEFERFGLQNAPAIGVAAAAFGVIGGGLLAGPVSGRLITKFVYPSGKSSTRGFDVIPEAPVVAASDADPAKPILAATNPQPEPLVDEGGFIDDLVNMFRNGGSVLIHFLILCLCLKLGAFFSVWMVQWGSSSVITVGNGIADGWEKLNFIPWLFNWAHVSSDFKLVFPGYIGAMIVAAIARNIHDLFGFKFIRSIHVDLLSSFSLAWMLAVVMITLRLGELVHSAGPMLVIVLVQTVIVCASAYWVVFRLMGKDYESAAMSAGFIGFALGATSNAVATMRQLNRRYGPSPRAFLIVTIVGAFLIDFTNAVFITTFLNIFKHPQAIPPVIP